MITLKVVKYRYPYLYRALKIRAKYYGLALNPRYNVKGLARSKRLSYLNRSFRVLAANGLLASVALGYGTSAYPSVKARYNRARSASNTYGAVALTRFLARFTTALTVGLAANPPS